jgi:hypothetical protein
MPHAICNTCSTLLHWSFQRKHEKRVCECGSKELTQVSGRWIETEDGPAWEYRDRKGQVRVTVLIEMETIKQ